ncbi:MAG: chromosome segregation protein SMC [Syntrophobacteria bacterium]
MHIKQLELFAFKSFMDRTLVNFSTGICAVVGPNGCGKSNIVDALRWVLGEQSAKQLRGRLMEEVIFSGANGRPSLNFAEVSLVLSAEDGKAPPPYHECSEIMVTRRLFRSGDSEYFINKVPCRRMDTSKLFMDAGIGYRHYAIIEQGKISQVVESRPDDIRALIEEAAGITKFKAKKKAALRKIELTRHNLLRLGDIIAEISRNLSTLRRQAQRANRYRTLKKEIKRLEIARAQHYYRQWHQELKSLEQDLRGRKDAQSGQAARLAALDAELTERSSRTHELEQKVQKRRESVLEIKNAISSDENSLKHLERQSRELSERRQRLAQEIQEQDERQQRLTREKDRLASEEREVADACSQAEVLAAEVNEELNREKANQGRTAAQLDALKSDLVELLGQTARIRNQQVNIDKRLEELDGRCSRREREYGELQASRDLVEPQKQRLEADIAATRAGIEEQAAEADSLRRRIQQLEQAQNSCMQTINALESSYYQQQSQLEVAAEMERSYAWFNDAVRSLMNAREKEELQCKILGVVAEMMVVDAPHRQAVEAVLGGRLQALVVDSLAGACSAVEHLKRTGTGRGNFIPLPATSEAPRPVTGGDGPVPLASVVKPHPGYESIVHCLLSKVLYCTDLKQALAWWQSHPHSHVLVTAEGDLLTQDGTLWGGSPERQISILEKQDERKDLERKVAELEENLQTERQKARAVEEEMAQATSRLQTIESRQRQLGDRLLEQEKERYRLEAEQQKIADRLAMLDLEKDQEEEDSSNLLAERTQNQRDLEDLGKRQQELEDTLAEAQKKRQELEITAESLQERATAQQVTLGTLVEKKRAARSSYKRLEEYHAEGERRLRQLREESESCQRQLERVLKEQQVTKRRLEQAQRHLLEQEESHDAEEKHWHEVETRQRDLEARRLELLREDKEQEQKIQGLHQEITELNLKIQYLVHQIQERYQLNLDEQVPRETEEPVDLAGLEGKLQRLRDRVARIGEVNLTAIQEYEDQRRRHDFLIAQRDDLVQSLEGLKRAMSRIHRTTRRRFVKTLDAVNRKLAEVFPLLFNGGSARLQLFTDCDPLEAGVEILVHPPGKRLTSMSLLSGGEKALAAVALLFSLYMIRPSPFCILDEIDATLDEANIDRFNAVLKMISRNSQVIMITHNKRTMEISDFLLGVTMEEPGVSRIMSVDFQGALETSGMV